MANQTVYCWQLCPSGCRSSSLERSARGRRLIVIIADFPPSTKNSSFSTFMPSPDFFWPFDWHRYSGPCSNVRYLGHFKKFVFTYLLINASACQISAKSEICCWVIAIYNHVQCIAAVSAMHQPMEVQQNRAMYGWDVQYPVQPQETMYMYVVPFFREWVHWTVLNFVM